MMKRLTWVCAATLAFGAIACGGEDGAQGPTGPEGPTGPAGPAGATGPSGMNGQDGMDGQDGMNGQNGMDGQDGMNGMDGQDGMNAPVVEIAGSLATAAGPAGEGEAVFVVAIDDTGSPIGQFGGTFTDANGDFSISVDDGVIASTRLAVFAEVAGTRLIGTVTSSTGIRVDPVSTGLIQAIVLITETPMGRTLNDFSTTEVASLYTQGSTELATLGTDLADEDAVLQDLIASIGGLIADASGGTIGVAVAALPTPPDVVTDGGPSFDYNLTSGLGAIYDIQSDGELDDGRSSSNQGDACDDCNQLRVDGSLFPFGTGGVVEDNSELRLGPVSLSGLDVTRLVWVSPVTDLLRYTEVLSNPSGAAISASITLTSNLGADSSSQVVATSSGDAAADAADTWIAYNDANLTGTDPTTFFWFGNATSFVSDTGATNQLVVTYDVTVPVGGQVTIVHFFAALSDPQDQGSIAAVAADVNTFDSLGGMQPADFASNITGVTLGGYLLAGEAGSVASFANVTVSQTSTTTTQMTQAASDGSFGLGVGGATGETITVTADDGTSQMLTLP